MKYKKSFFLLFPLILLLSFDCTQFELIQIKNTITKWLSEYNNGANINKNVLDYFDLENFEEIRILKYNIYDDFQVEDVNQELMISNYKIFNINGIKTYNLLCKKGNTEFYLSMKWIVNRWKISFYKKKSNYGNDNR